MVLLTDTSLRIVACDPREAPDQLKLLSIHDIAPVDPKGGLA